MKYEHPRGFVWIRRAHSQTDSHLFSPADPARQGTRLIFTRREDEQALCGARLRGYYVVIDTGARHPAEHRDPYPTSGCEDCWSRCYNDGP